MRLGVNVDHVATVRQARRGQSPDPVDAAQLCVRAGATSIVCHLREDRRHIQDDDVRRLRRTLSVPLNLEMSLAPEIVAIALRIRPAQVTFVPERRQELTTEGGLNVVRHAARIQRAVRAFHARGIAVSLFIDPVAVQIRASAAVGARIVELHTGAYAQAQRAIQRRQQRAQVARAAAQARRLKLAVAAGHGLDYDNVHVLATIPEIEELNIGFAIMSRALAVGLPAAVRQMRRLLR
jgi:pyridoxine 5-phosphate synthase